MSKDKRKRSVAEIMAIKRYYAEKAAMKKTDPDANAPDSAVEEQVAEPSDEKRSNVGKVYRGETKYIDKEPKKQRDYVVVRDGSRGVSVAKLKTIKKFDESGKNADPALVEINHERYGLPNRTGVDYERFDRNRMSGKPLQIEDKDVFPEERERFKLGSSDTHKALVHTGIVPKSRKKKK